MVSAINFFLDQKKINSKKTRPETTSNWKRTYTEKELQAALNDIQSGKLGTRRAAVIYGIPRSTLRNKVYKLCSDRKKGTSPVSASNTKASTLASTNKANPDSSANDRNALCNISRSPSLISSKNIDNVDNKVAIELLNNCKSSNLKDKSDVDNIATSMNNFSIAREAILEVLKKAINQRGSKSYYPQPTHMVNSSNDTNVQKGNKEASDLTNSMNMLIDPLATNQILPTLDRGNTIGPLLYQILLNVHNLPWLSPSPTDATVNNNNNNYNNYNNSELDKRISNTLPLLHELIPKLVQERLKAETNQSTNDATRDSTTPSIGSNIASDGYCDNSNFILKVPSFQPKSSPEASSVPSLVSPVCPTSNKMTPALSSAVNTNNISTPASSYSSAKLLSSDIPSSYSTHGDRKDIVNLMNDSNMSDSNTCISSHSHGDRRDNFTTMLKDENHVIGKSSNSGNKSLNCISTILSVHSDESSSDALMNENKDSSSTQRHKKVDKRNLATLSTASDQSAPSTPDPKRNRPKRGRYRNYKRDDLARAVRAVQMGEMSVHRAGTHFGVPHSTLEYKVKERHLLRPKKRQTNASSSSSSSLIKKDDNNNNRSLLIQPKNTLTESTTQSSGALNQANNISNFSLWQAALPLLPFDIGSTQNSSNYFASNIMRKLKENARLNQEISNITNLSNSNSTSAIANSLNNSTGENNINSNSLGTNISNINNDNNNNNNSKEYGSFLLESLIKSSLEKRNSNHSSRDSDEESDKEGAKFNSSLAALKKVTSLDAIKE